MQVLFSNSLDKIGNNKVEKREDGASKVILGALNAFNVHNELYLIDGVKNILSNGGYHSLSSKLTRGLLKGEANHPFKLPGMTDSEFVNRNLIVDNTLASHHILEVLLEETDEVEANGAKVVLIWGWIKPTDNEHGRALKASLEDESVNVAFSIRCFSVLRNINGVACRYITNIVTWDWVDNPGIARAVKPATSKSSLTTENASIGTEKDIVITKDMIEELKDKNSDVTTENGGTMTILNTLEKRISGDAPLYKRW